MNDLVNRLRGEYPLGPKDENGIQNFRSFKDFIPAVSFEAADRIEELQEQYQDLIMQVVNKIPGESRHETAKRIIRQAESRESGPAQEAE